MTTVVTPPKPAPAPSVPPPMPGPGAEAAATAQPTSILAVDDEPRSLYAIKELLDAPGVEVVLAHSGEEALQQVLKREFALILLDVRMPGMDGFETARLIRGREKTRSTPILFLTGASEDVENIFKGYQIGAADYLIKPVLVPEVLRSKVAVFVDLHNKNAALARSEEQLRLLAGYLLGVREEERAHIAREIHDELGQVLTALKMDVSWIAKNVDPDERGVIDKTASMGRLIDSTVRTVRRIAAGLRPEVLDEMGLAAAIQWQAKEFQKRSGVRVRIDLPPELPRLRLDVTTAVFRIFQEILTNVARHSRATRLEIRLEPAGDQLLLEVKDNGMGMASTEVSGRKTLGLLGMQERALLFGGTVRFTSAKDQGTTVTVTIPMARAQ
jgi:signal transduction histidine kinase